MLKLEKEQYYMTNLMKHTGLRRLPMRPPPVSHSSLKNSFSSISSLSFDGKRTESSLKRIEEETPTLGSVPQQLEGDKSFSSEASASINIDRNDNSSKATPNRNPRIS